MEAIIQKLDSAYDECVKKNAALGIREIKLSEQEKLFSERVKKTSDLEADLKAREAKVKEIEQPMDLLAQAKKEKADIAEARKALQAEKTSFNDYLAKERKDLSGEKIKVNGEKITLAKGLELLKKDRAALAEEKKNYKDNFLKELTKKVK